MARKRRKSGRRTRRNSSSLSASFSPVNIIRTPLNLNKWKGIGVQLMGLVGTTFLATKALDFMPTAIRGNSFGRVATRLVAGSVLSILAKKVRPGLASEVQNGALLSGVSYALQEFFPTYFKGLNGDEGWYDYGMDGMGDFADPRQMANPYALGDFADPRQMANPYALGDFADPRQMANPYALGYQDSLVAEQLASEMV
jgi:hypothetical protein